MQVFIVEDSPVLRERLTLIFKEIRGVQIAGHAATATEAIERIHRTRPDVVILDIRLEQGNGFQVLRSIKQEPPAPYVIVLTNYPYPPYRRRFIEQGADYFFDKSTELPKAIDALKYLRQVVAARGAAQPNMPRADADPALRMQPRSAEPSDHSHYSYHDRIGA